MRRSSAERKVAPSLFTEMELMWYVCAFEKTRRGVATVCASPRTSAGTRSCATGTRPP